MKILALEFSSPQRSVAVSSTGATAEVLHQSAGRTMQPLRMIESALKQAGLEREQVECLAVGLGPGSYNGIRVGIALAQGWQLALNVKLLGISSAECIAAQAQTDGVEGDFSVVIDAQRGEFYAADYSSNNGNLALHSPLELVSREEVQRREQTRALVGPEITRWFEKGRIVFPRAERLCQLARKRDDFVPGNTLEPIYLRQTSFVKAPPSRTY